MMRAFRELLVTPGARGFVVAGAVGRLPMAMLGIAVILTVAGVTDSYRIAGAAAGAYAASQAFAAPFIGRLADVHGQARTLLPLATGHCAAIIGLMSCAAAHAPFWTLIGGAGAAGATLPPLGSLVRARWIAAVRGSDRLAAAMALESTVDELLFITGPVLVGLLAAAWHPLAAILACALLTLGGSIALVLLRRSEPRVRRNPVRPTLGVALEPTIRVLVAVFFALGAVSGSAGLALVAFADSESAGSGAAGGLLLGCFAGGAFASGLWYGARVRRPPLPTQLVIAVAVLCAVFVPPTFVTNNWLMGLAAFIAGLGVAPVAIIGFALLAHLASGGPSNESLAWLSAATGGGVAVGSWLAGEVAEATGGTHTLLMPLVCAAVAGGVATGAHRVLRAPGAVKPLAREPESDTGNPR